MKNKLLLILMSSIFLMFGSAFAGEKYEFTGTAYNTSGFEAPIVTASEAQIWNWSNDLFGFMMMLQKGGLKKLWQTVRVKVLQIKMAYL